MRGLGISLSKVLDKQLHAKLDWKLNVGIDRRLDEELER